MLSARAIALQGVGFAPAVLALQGFVAADEIAVLPAGGGELVTRPKKRPAWVVPPQFIDPPRRPREEAEALMLCGLI